MHAALKIVVDVLVYRLQRLEMANMAGAVAVMVALRLPLGEIVVRGAFAFVLNVLAYLVNDVVDVERDLASGRAPEKTRFLAAHRGAALAAEALLGAALIAIAVWYDLWLLVPAALGTGICWIYKRVPIGDVVAMTLWGAAMPLSAIEPDSALGWALIGMLALFSTCFELIQVIRDRASDQAIGVTTTAVWLGEARTWLLLRVAMLLAAAYAIAFLHRFVGIGLLFAPLLSTGTDPERYWNRVRLVFGVVWLAIVLLIAFSGASYGALTVLYAS
jgi:4-hydroxybenzoate polyprenyltransferase